MLTALLAAPAQARDLHLSRLSTGDCASTLGTDLILQQTGTPTLRPDQAAFRELVAQLAEAASPTQIAPVTTSGPAGFDVALETTFSTLTKSDAMRRALGDGAATCDVRGSAPSSLLGNRLRFSKGLPLGFSLGAQAGLIHDTDLYVVGVDAQLALLEEVWRLPDLALRAAVTRLVGAQDLTLYAISFDALLSHRFVLFQRAELSPFAGAGARWTHASARTDLTPNIDAVDCAAGRDAICNAGGLGASRDDFAHDVRFERVSQLRYRAFAGVRLRVARFALAGAVAFDPVAPRLDDRGRGDTLARQWTLSVAPSVTF
ncbi:MAG TPA: hypothetical protein VFX59_17215 [Polyangiales bacterium]|nr:hypothetical protein [Polyangiales bacterium]